MASATLTAPLVGEELVAKVKELAGAPKSTIVRECGYIGTRKRKNDAGEMVETESLQFSEFQEALVLATSGIDLTPSKASSGGDGRRTASYRTKVHKSGALVIGAAYCEGFEPGTEFAIIVGENAIQLVLVGVDGEPEEAVFPED
jgi:hypothetical protein